MSPFWNTVYIVRQKLSIYSVSNFWNKNILKQSVNWNLCILLKKFNKNAENMNSSKILTSALSTIVEEMIVTNHWKLSCFSTHGFV